MARCEECIHYGVCLKFVDVRIILCGDKADTRCCMFKPAADVAPRAEVAREIFEEIKKNPRKPIPEAKPVYVLTEEQLADMMKKYTEENTDGSM